MFHWLHDIFASGILSRKQLQFISGGKKPTFYLLKPACLNDHREIGALKVFSGIFISERRQFIDLPDKFVLKQPLKQP